MALVFQTCLPLQDWLDYACYAIAWLVLPLCASFCVQTIWEAKRKGANALVGLAVLLLLCMISKDLLKVDWPRWGQCPEGTGFLVVARYSMPSTHGALVAFFCLYLVFGLVADLHNVRSTEDEKDLEIADPQFEALLRQAGRIEPKRTRIQVVARSFVVVAAATAACFSRIHVGAARLADTMAGVLFGTMVFLLTHAYLSVGPSVQQNTEKLE